MTTTAPTRPAGQPRATRSRYLIMVMLFITVVINYLDRSNLSIAAPALTSELGIDPIHVGLIFSAFGWTYAAMQIPGGWLVDRVPPRILYTVALMLWSIATILLGFAASFIALFVLRMAVGARQSDILKQFLIEAVLVCLVGGVLGIALALLIGFVFDMLAGGAFSMVISTTSIILAFACSTLIGVLFGFLPARRAAQLDPVDALSRQ